MNKEDVLNLLIKGSDTNQISDGYHTFGELYEHRIVLYIALCRELNDAGKSIVWRSTKHADGSTWEGWFVLGIGEDEGEQITYHLPMSKWEDCSFALEIDKPKSYDGHTSNDVLERLSKL